MCTWYCHNVSKQERHGYGYGYIYIFDTSTVELGRAIKQT